MVALFSLLCPILSNVLYRLTMEYVLTCVHSQHWCESGENDALSKLEDKDEEGTKE